LDFFHKKYLIFKTTKAFYNADNFLHIIGSKKVKFIKGIILTNNFINLKKTFHIYFFLCVIFLNTILQLPAQTTLIIDSAKKIINSTQLNKSNYINTCFFIADSYMDEDQYDSTQIWLNKIYEKIPAKLNSVENYYLISRQAEVYYYNNLQQLGLQESLRGVEMAKVINDSFLLADAYNFSGLFFIGVDSLKAATQYLLNGIKYLNQPPYIEKYTGLAKPHHLYGNVAEAYFKQQQWDSAIFYSNLSLKAAEKIKMNRGVAIAYNSLGDAYFGKNILDTAIENFTKSFGIALQNKYYDVALLCKSGLAKCFFKKDDKANAILLLKEGRILLQQNENINSFFAIQFLNTAIALNEKLNENNEVMTCSNLKRKIQEQSTAKENAQIKTILNASIVNEKRLLSLEVQDVKQKEKIYNITLLLLLLLLALGIGSFFLYRYYKNRKMDLANIKQKISQELHDDVGATLSSLYIYSDLANRTLDSDADKTKQLLQKINIESKDAMEKLNNVVWSIKDEDKNPISISLKIKDSITKILEFKNINIIYRIEKSIDKAIKSVTAKKFIIVYLKEIFNIIAKTNTTEAIVDIFLNDDHLNIIVNNNSNDLASLLKAKAWHTIQLKCNDVNVNINLTTDANSTTVTLVISKLSIVKQ
jgi:signal transduction histidine kinase